VLSLTKDRKYKSSVNSRAFPFLPMREFEAFARRMIIEDQMTVQLEFEAWVRTLPR
jgi:hypothetical protein